MKSPKWDRDELILALDLYFRLDSGQMHAKNEEVIEVSDILNVLPIHSNRPDIEKFRNPNGVGLKLNNFKFIDPDYAGKGMSRIGKLDKLVFEEFVNDKALLTRLARQIKASILNKSLRKKIYEVGDEAEDLNTVKEGKVLFKIHKVRERDYRISKKKKASVLKEKGVLSCEVCDFDFHEVYGELGADYIECHHITPLSEIDTETNTRLEDLALVCANCHRMLHRRISTLGVKELKKLLKR